MKNPTSSTGNASGHDAPAVTVVEITDPTAAGDNIEFLDQDVVQLQSNPLRAKRVIVRLVECVVVYQSTNQPVRTRSRASPDLIGFVAFGQQAEGTFNGLAVRPDLLLAVEPGVAGEFVVGAGYDSVTVFLPPAELRKQLDIRQRADEFRFPRGVEILQSSTSDTRTLFDWGKNVAETAVRQPELFDDHVTSRETACIELLEMLLAALASSKEYESTRGDRTMQTHSRIVHVAEDHATTHTGKRVSVTELCEAADVSERTLQYAFQKVMGMTPVAYLTRLRLHRVRQTLRKSTDGTTTVSAAALRWGFWHFSDFSRMYKICFGESPSTTLKQFKFELKLKCKA